MYGGYNLTPFASIEFNEEETFDIVPITFDNFVKVIFSKEPGSRLSP